jgi:hypothetical protein
MHLFEHEQFTDLALRVGFTELTGEMITLPSGKEFFYAIYSPKLASKLDSHTVQNYDCKSCCEN